MAVFLHEPVSTPDEVLLLVRDRVPEGKHLDYMAAWSGAKPDQQEEAGKDVAAFANSEGGDIVVGIEEGPPGIPVGFFPRVGVLYDAQVRAWLNNVLVPREVVSTVRVRHHVVNDGHADCGVLVVSVPPWPDGIVGVDLDREHTERHMARLMSSMGDAFYNEGGKHALARFAYLLDKPMLVVPLSQVVDAWEIEPEGPVHLLLRVTAVLNHVGWVIEAGSS